MSANVYILMLLNIVNLWSISAFNVDTNVPIIKTGRPDSYFGFSVAQHQRTIDWDNDISEHVIIVGAPQDNITDTPSLASVDRPGAIWYCPITSRDNDCQPVKIHRSNPSSREDRNRQWMGVSLTSQGKKNGVAVACAHRFKRVGPGHRWGFGLCIAMTNELDEDRAYEPCEGKSTQKGHNEYGFCQAGYSADVSKDGDLLVGTPGAFNWRGGVFKNIVEFPSLAILPKWYPNRIEDPPRGSDLPDPPVSYYSFLGASTKVSNLLDGRRTYISGAPRSVDKGQVLFFTYTEDDTHLEVDQMHILTGEQFGSQFGFDVTVVDFNNDGLEDLVVSAPFYFDQHVGGMIYVYMNDKENNITSDTEPIKIASPERKRDECKALNCETGRFGFSLAPIGDMDLDGYDDLAVGAPFEGNGAIYIFRGSKDGVIPKYSQRIYADDLITAQPLTSFGYSLVGGNDIDNNGYPDLVAGAYESSKAIVMRARPVVTINAYLTAMPPKIDPSQTTCSFDNKQNYCFEMHLCMKFEAKPVEKFTEKLTIEYTLEAEKYTGKEFSRVMIRGAKPDESHTITRTFTLDEQNLNVFKCKSHIVYLQRSNKDFLNPIYFRLSYDLQDQITPVMNPGDRLPDLNFHPVLNQQERSVEEVVDFLKNCGKDNVCLSDLSLDARFAGLSQNNKDDFIYKMTADEVSKELKLEIIVENNGEDAHEASLTIKRPAYINYIGAYGDSECTLINNIITCDLGNPMGKGGKAMLTVRLDASSVPANPKKAEFLLQLNTTSVDVMEDNNSKLLKVRFMIETDLEVTGKSDPTQVFYSGDIIGESAIDFEDQIGPEVVHEYTISNIGKSRVPRSSVVIMWPYEVQSNYTQGKHLLYLMQPPIARPPISCQFDPRYINPIDVIISSGTDPMGNNNTSTKVVLDLKEAKSRRKRDTVIKSEMRNEGGKVFEVVTMDCDRKSAKCFPIRCDLGTMEQTETRKITLRARLWQSTFLEDYRTVDRVVIQSKTTVIIDPVLNIKQTKEDNDVFYVQTFAIPDIDVAGDGQVPIWIIILAVIGGLIVLIIIIILLVKCGFFRRNRADEMRRHKCKVEKKKYDDDDRYV